MQQFHCLRQEFSYKFSRKYRSLVTRLPFCFDHMIDKVLYENDDEHCM